jgi:hypothetical protein
MGEKNYDGFYGSKSLCLLGQLYSALRSLKNQANMATSCDHN